MHEMWTGFCPYPHSRPKMSKAEIVDEMAILHECAKSQEPPISEDRLERQLLAE